MIIVCDRCSEDKSAGLGTYYHIIIQILDLLLHGIDCQVQSVRILHAGTVTENGRVSGPTISTTSPAANLLRRESVASPSGVQSVTMAQTCQSRI